MPIPEIERIFSCDENGRALVEKARREASELVASADTEIQRLREQYSKELDKFRKDELAGILDSASEKANALEEEAKEYCDALKGRLGRHKDHLARELVSMFIRNATGH